MQQEAGGSYLHMGFLQLNTDCFLVGPHYRFCMVVVAEECSKRLVAAICIWDSSN